MDDTNVIEENRIITEGIKFILLDSFRETCLQQ